MSGLIQAVNGTVYEYGQAGADLYFTNGGMIDWTFGTYNIPSYTLELPPIDEEHGGFFNAEEDIQPIFNENLPAMLYLIDWSVQNFPSSIPSVRRGRRYGPRANLKDKSQFGREPIDGGEDEATTQRSKLKSNDPKTSSVKSNTIGFRSKTTDVRIKKTDAISKLLNVKNKTINTGSRTINVRKYSPTVIKEHKRKKD